MTIYQRNRNNSKNGHLCTKITKNCMKTYSTKTKKRYYETIRHKICFYCIGIETWLVFTESKLKIDRINIKNWQVKKFTEIFLKTNIFNEIRVTTECMVQVRLHLIKKSIGFLKGRLSNQTAKRRTTKWKTQIIQLKFNKTLFQSHEKSLRFSETNYIYFRPHFQKNGIWRYWSF